MTLNELADRCEAATGEDSVLDMHIARIRDSNGKVLPQERYTRSIDVALTLVPEDRSWTLGKSAGFRAVGAVWSMGQASEGRAIAATPALALCAAALRALAISR